MQSCSAPQDAEASCKGLQLSSEFIMPHPVQTPHPVEMTLEMAVLHKFVQDALVDPRDGRGKEVTVFMIALQKPGRQDHVADTDRRRDRLGESPDIDHFSGMIQGLQSRDRLSPVAEFRIIIILNDIAVRLLHRPA